MATFAAQKPGSGRPWWKTVAALAGAGLMGALVLAAPARALTTGASDLRGDSILFLFGFPQLFNNTDAGIPDPTKPVDFKPTAFSYIKNEYLGVVLGERGTFSRHYFKNDDLTYDVAGRVSVGNVEGSRQTSADNNLSLNGRNLPSGELWPLAAGWTSNNGFDETGFVAINIDPKNPTDTAGGQVLGIDAKVRGFTSFHDNMLVTTFAAASMVQVRQTIRLRRATARFEWVITNTDAVNAHSVALQYVTNQDVIQSFVDPQRGTTTRPALYTGGTIPTTLGLTELRTNPLYRPRFTLRGFGATLPDQVLVGAINSFDYGPRYKPPGVAFAEYPSLAGSRVGAAVVVHWDASAIPPGGSRTIVTYFGNGAVTEDLAQDFVTAVEGVESLQFNSDAVASLRPDQKTGATLQTGAAFLTPSSFTIFGGIYNQTIADPEREVVLNNVSASLTLPPGLTLASGETPAKSLGDVRGDSEARVTWNVAPTGEAYGALTYQIAVSTPLGSRTVSRVINVPATPLRTLTNTDWQLISFPFAFNPTITNNGDPSTVLNGITAPADNPGGAIPIFRYDPVAAQNGGNVYPRATRLEPGVAYFYKPALNRTVLLNGAVPVADQAPPSGQPGTAFQVTLPRGWNMIGNPYVYDIPLAYLRLVPVENNPSQRSFTFEEAVTSGFIRGAVFFYSGQQGNTSRYDFFQSLADPLHPWVGYWLFVNNPVTLSYAAPTSVNSAVIGSTPVSRKESEGAIRSGRALVTNPTLDQWKLQLVARAEDGREDDATLLGVSRAAKSGDNIYDLPKPPPFRDYVYVGIVHEGAASRYAQDIQPPDGARSWDIEVVSDHEGRVTLMWPNMPALPKRLRLKMTDLATGHSVNLHSSSSLAFTAGKETAHRFRITAENGPSRPLDIVNLRSVATRGGGYKFDFDLTGPATVTGQVRTLSGKVTRDLETGRAAAPGGNSLHWDGRAQNGDPLPAGPYILEVRARGDGNEVATRVVPVMLLR